MQRGFALEKSVAAARLNLMSVGGGMKLNRSSDTWWQIASNGTLSIYLSNGTIDITLLNRDGCSYSNDEDRSL